MTRVHGWFLAGTLVALVSSSGCLQVRLASYAPCDGQMASRIAGLPDDSVTGAMRDSARAEERNCAIQNAMSAAVLNEQLRLSQEQQVEDVIRQQLDRQLLAPPVAPAPQP